MIREKSPDSYIIVGGPYIARLCRFHEEAEIAELLATMGADFYIVEAQGEASLLKLLQILKDPEAEIPDLPNVMYLDEDDQIVKGPTEEENNSLDQYAIDWSLLAPDFYQPTVQLRTARSCAFRCAFCTYPILGGQLTLMSLDKIEKELQYLAQQQVEYLVFIDDTFNVPLPRFKDICKMMIRNRFPFKWFSYFRCSHADSEVFDLMAESGCQGVFLGIESGDERILKNMNKHTDIERYRHGIKELNKRHIITYASIIVGFPGETLDSIANTVQFIQETCPMFWRAELYFHLTNAPIQQRAKEFGLVGAGYSWKHDTMDWQTAVAQIGDMYKAVSNSILLPLHSFDFWTIPYLMGKGFSVQSISQFLNLSQKLILQSLDDDSDNAASFINALADVITLENRK